MLHACLLFLPGSRPDMLPKALDTAAGIVCIDLEDGVAPDARSAARDFAVRALSSARSSESERLAVRINHPGSDRGIADFEAILAAPPEVAPLTVLVPKVGDPAELGPLAAGAADRGRPLRLVPLIETAQGVVHAEGIAAADGVAAMLLGGLDLSADLGSTFDWGPLLYARSRLVVAARAAGVAPWDTPYPQIADTDGLRAEAERARQLGFSGKAAIHPSQVDVIDRAFAPTPEEIERARRVVEAHDRAGDGAFRMDDAMIDAPLVRAARTVLERAARHASIGSSETNA